MMLKIIGVLLGIVSASSLARPQQQEVISITIDNPAKKGYQTKRMKLFMGILQSDNDDLMRMVPFLTTDLELSKQFSVTVEHHELPKSKETITDLYNRGFVLAFFINSTPGNDGFEWRLYNTSQASMESGKRCLKLGSKPAEWAHMLAHDMWVELMGCSGPFLSRLCYIKKVPNPRFKSVSHLCVSNVTDNQERVIFTNNRITVAPYWSLSKSNPFLVCSEFTNSNVRLLSVDLYGNRRIVLDFDGTTAGVSFQPDGEDILYGHSGGIWRYHYDPRHKRARHTLLIKESDACASPTLLSNGDIIYCSQGKIKCYESKTKTRQVIIGDGYTVGPAFHERSNKIVYSKRVKGDMQLFLFDRKTKHNERLTFGVGDKTDPAWSPCGTWVAYCTQNKSKSRIAILNVKTHHVEFVTSAEDDCRYPSWSPLLSHLTV